MGEHGTSTLELIVVLPALLVVMFGSLELSRAWLTVNLATTAVREAARAGAVAGPLSFPDPPTAVARLNAVLGAGNWTGSVTCSVAPCAPDAQVTVDVTVTFETLVPAVLPMLGSIPIRQTASMRYE